MTDDRDDKAQADGQGAVLRQLIKARNSHRVGAGTAPALPQTAAPTPARAAATAVGRAAEELYEMPVKPLKIAPGGATLAELAELLPDPALLAVVQGSADRVGVVAMCPAAVTALIEMQALGRVTRRPMEKRRPTASDAMICADFVNALLGELQAELSGLEGFEGYQGFRYASHLDDPRPLLLLMEDVTYRTLTMQLSLGGRDTREARIFVALPQAAMAALPAPRHAAGKAAAVAAAGKTPDSSAGSAALRTTSSGPDLSAAVQAAPVELSGVLCRRRITLAQLRVLQKGGALSLPRVSLMDARLETRQGQLIAQGKLGEADGCYAIRLHDPVTALSAAPAPMSASLPGAPAFLSGTQPSAAATGDSLLPDPGEPPMDDLAQPDSFRPDPAVQQGGEIDTDGPPLHSAAG